MIELNNVTKTFWGNTTALKGLSLKLPEQGIYCLVGRNGAGKTTLFRLIAGHITASEGTVTVNGKVVSGGRIATDVHYLVSGAKHFNMNVVDLINTASALQDGFDRDFAFKMVKAMSLKKRISYEYLSLGMKTMVSTILSLASNAKVILLDEPTLGLDAIVRSQFNSLLLERYQNNPSLIVVSTHLIDEISKVAEYLVVLNKGKIAAEIRMDEIDEKAYSLSGPTQVVMPLIDGLNCIGQKTLESMTVAHIFDERITVPNSVRVDRLSPQDFFVSIIGGNKYE